MKLRVLCLPKNIVISLKWRTAMFQTPNSHLTSTLLRLTTLHVVFTVSPIVQVAVTKFISSLIELHYQCHRYSKYPLSKYHCPAFKGLKKCPVQNINSVKIKSRENLVLSSAIFFLDTNQNFTLCNREITSSPLFSRCRTTTTLPN